MYIFNKILITSILILCFTINIYPEIKEGPINYYKEKDPFVAGLLSATMMGLGQFYTKDYLKGSVFVFTDLLQKGMIIYLISYLNNHYTDEDSNDEIVEWKEINNTDRAVVLGFIGFYFGSRLYCIIDAISSAKKYNANLREEFSRNDLKMNYLIGSDSLGVSLSKNF